MRPYLFKDGKKYYLPESILEGGENEGSNMGTLLYDGDIMLADFQIDSVTVQGAKKGFKLLENLPDGTVASVNVGDSIDPDFAITAIAIQTKDTTNTTATKWITGLNIIASLQSSFFYSVENVYADADYNANGTLKTGATPVSDKLFGNIDLTTGVLNLASAFDKILGVRVRGRLSPEMNVRSESVSFDITTKDINVGTGTHLNAPLPIEFLQDVMAMYNVDGAAKVVDYMIVHIKPHELLETLIN